MPKKKRKPRKQVDVRLKNFEAAFRSTRKPWKVLTNHRKLLGIGNYPNAWRIVAERPKLFNHMKQWLLPKDLSWLNLYNVAGNTSSLIDELSWALECILVLRSNVSAFLKYKVEFERALRSADLAGAQEVLDELNREVCMSYWALERTIGLHQKSGGFEGNKQFIEPILGNKTLPSILRHLVQQLSIRNEENTPVIWQFGEYKKLLGSWGVHEDLSGFLKYKAFRPLTEDINYPAILSRGTGGSIVDMYEDFVLALVQAAKEEPQAALRLAEKACGLVDDPRLIKILFSLTGKRSLLNSFPARKAEVSMLSHSGDLLGALHVAKDLSQHSGSNLSELLECAKVIFDTNAQDQVGNEVVAIATEVLGKKGDFLYPYNELIKLSINCAPQEFEFVVNNFLATEFLGEPFHSGPGLDFAEFVFSPEITHSHLLLLKNSEAQAALASELTMKLGKTASLYACMSNVASAPDKYAFLSPDYACLAKIESNLRIGNAVSLKLAKQLACSDLLRVRRYGGRYVSYELINEQNTEELIEFVGQAVVADVGAKFTLPMKKIGEILTKEICREFCYRIELPILLSVVQEFIYDEDDRRLLYAYEDYLRTQGASKPTDILELGERSHDPLLNYFLKHVCTTDTLSNSIAFESNRDVEDERLRICSYMLMADPEHAADYDAEIEELSKKQAVDAVLSQVEQSKIYADTDSIKDWAVNELKPAYARYIKYLQSGIGKDGSAFSEDVITKILRNEPLSEELMSETPKDEAYQILVDMLIRLQNKFFFDSLYGLDSYLSVRIRHGAISAQLREPFSQYGLITQKVTGTNEYEENAMWGDLLEDQPAVQKQLNGALSDFSREVDNLIEKISKDYIQIRSEEHPYGLLAPVLTVVQVRLFASEIEVSTTIEEFVDMAFGVLWSTADHGLAQIRKFIETDILSRFVALFDGLERFVADLQGGRNLANLSTNIKLARADMVQAVSRFVEWFRRTNMDKIQHVCIGDIAEAALTSVRRARYKDFAPTLEIEGDGQVGVYSGQISFFNDVFFILFENVMKHSGLSGAFDIHMSIRWAEGKLGFVVENDLSDKLDVEQRETELGEIERQIASDEYLEKVNKEGKTGLLKLYKLLGGRSGRFDPELKFSVSSSPRKYRVSFNMNIIEASDEENADS